MFFIFVFKGFGSFVYSEFTGKEELLRTIIYKFYGSFCLDRFCTTNTNYVCHSTPIYICIGNKTDVNSWYFKRSRDTPSIDLTNCYNHKRKQTNEIMLGNVNFIFSSYSFKLYLKVFCPKSLKIYINKYFMKEKWVESHSSTPVIRSYVLFFFNSPFLE